MRFKDWMSTYMKDNNLVIPVMVSEKSADNDDNDDAKVDIADKKKVQSYEVPKN